MVENKALDEMQSAYRQHNLKETALMKVQQNTQHWRSATLSQHRLAGRDKTRIFDNQVFFMMKRLHLVLALWLVLVTLIAVSSGQDSVKTEREGYETEVDRGMREVDRGVREVDRGVREVDEDDQNDVDMIKRIKRSIPTLPHGETESSSEESVRLVATSPHLLQDEVEECSGLSLDVSPALFVRNQQLSSSAVEVVRTIHELVFGPTELAESTIAGRRFHPSVAASIECDTSENLLFIGECMRMWRWAGGRRWWEAVGKRLGGGGDVVGDGGRLW
ncbi:hypothetical protein LSAT2_003810 [Lamellibrachia satsuma]|nr:hypothetical protein LSAT2_003810 [Lamellibrachia satsuma]